MQINIPIGGIPGATLYKVVTLSNGVETSHEFAELPPTFEIDPTPGVQVFVVAHGDDGSVISRTLVHENAPQPVMRVPGEPVIVNPESVYRMPRAKRWLTNRLNNSIYK